MICPHCKKNSIPYFKIINRWGRGTFTCPACNKKLKSKVKKNIVLTAISWCLLPAWLSIFLFLYQSDWFFFLGLTVVVILSTLIDYKLRKLKPVSEE